MELNASSFAERPKELSSFDTFKSAYPIIQQQNQNLQLMIFRSSRDMDDALLGLLFGSQYEKRWVKDPASGEDEPIERELLSHIPNNIMKCPVVLKRDAKTGAAIEVCTEKIDALPHLIDYSKSINTTCPVHKVEMVWKDWNPPLTESGFEEVRKMIISTMTTSITNSTFPKEFDVVTYSLGFAEGIQETIYDNADQYINNKDLFLSEAFWYNLENTIITNVESGLYKSKTSLVEKMIKQWNVQEDYSSAKPLGAPRGTMDKIKNLVGM